MIPVNSTKDNSYRFYFTITIENNSCYIASERFKTHAYCLVLPLFLTPIAALLLAIPTRAGGVLDKVEIQADRDDFEARQTVPSTRLIYGREELDRMNELTVGDYLRRLPGVTFSGTPGWNIRAPTAATANRPPKTASPKRWRAAPSGKAHVMFRVLTTWVMPRCAAQNSTLARAWMRSVCRG